MGTRYLKSPVGKPVVLNLLDVSLGKSDFCVLKLFSMRNTSMGNLLKKIIDTTAQLPDCRERSVHVS